MSANSIATELEQAEPVWTPDQSPALFPITLAGWPVCDTVTQELCCPLCGGSDLVHLEYIGVVRHVCGLTPSGKVHIDTNTEMLWEDSKDACAYCRSCAWEGDLTGVPIAWDGYEEPTWPEPEPELREPDEDMLPGRIGR